MSVRVLHFTAGAIVLACSLCAAVAEDTNTLSPIDLPTALRLAGAQNLEIQLARERLNEAEAARTSALERFFPWIAPGISYHRRDGVAQAVPAGTISDAHFQSYSPAVTVTAQLELGDAIYRNLAAKQLVRASDHALETQRQEAIVQAARAYFDLAKAKALIGVATAALRTSQEYQQQLHEAVGAGIAFKGDELRVQTQTKQYEMSNRQAMEQQRVAAVELARVLHLDSTVELVPQDNGLNRLTLFQPKQTATALVAQALRSRPELKEKEALIAAARDNKKGAVYGPWIPSVNAQVIGGGLGGGPDGGPDHFGAEGDYLFGLSWRIGPGGFFDSGRIRTSKSRLAAEELTGAKLKDDITAQVVAGLARVQSLSDQLGMAEAKLASATEALRVTHERKQFGVGAVLEDLQAQQDLERARSDYVNVVTEYNIAQYRLSRAAGQPPGAESEPSFPPTSALARIVNFDDMKTGAPPPGWTATNTGKGDTKWEVVADDSSPSKPNVLKQSGEATYPVCIKDDTSLKDGFVEVRFKPVSGKEDQAGGVIWRCKDADNYYIARANALEDNVTIYHTIKGKRISFKNVNTKVASTVWHTLRVDFEGNKFTVTFDGEKVIEATDNSFSDAGKVGVWTKADSVTLFDDFAYGPK